MERAALVRSLSCTSVACSRYLLLSSSCRSSLCSSILFLSSSTPKAKLSLSLTPSPTPTSTTRPSLLRRQWRLLPPLYFRNSKHLSSSSLSPRAVASPPIPSSPSPFPPGMVLAAYLIILILAFNNPFMLSVYNCYL